MLGFCALGQGGLQWHVDLRRGGEPEEVVGPMVVVVIVGGVASEATEDF
jgi:hypothetical protein